MEDVKLNLHENGEGKFLINDGNEELGEMVVAVCGKNLMVYHTEVAPKAEGRGLAKKMFGEMVQYARKNGLKVIARCPYVAAQLQRHPDEFADIWDKGA